MTPPPPHKLIEKHPPMELHVEYVQLHVCKYLGKFYNQNLWSLHGSLKDIDENFGVLKSHLVYISRSKYIFK